MRYLFSVCQLREARHVRKAVNQVLSTKGKRGQDFERVIVLDHDLEFSPSVLTFFETAAGVLNQDLSLFAVSAWNELGLPHLAGAESRMTRDSYFSGVAWMMHQADWAALDGDWPSDDVLREHGWVHWANDRAEAAGTHGGLAPDVALRWSVEGWDDTKRRDVAIPEVSRVKRSGGGAYDPEEAPLQRYSERVVLATSQPDATAFGDLSYMKEDAYEAALRAKIRNAKLLPGMSVPPMAATAVPTVLQKTAWVLAYEPKQYAAVAKRLQIPERPMGQFKGATILTRKDSSVSHLYLCPDLHCRPFNLSVSTANFLHWRLILAVPLGAVCCGPCVAVYSHFKRRTLWYTQSTHILSSIARSSYSSTKRRPSAPSF